MLAAPTAFSLSYLTLLLHRKNCGTKSVAFDPHLSICCLLRRAVAKNASVNFI
jgi:hypothetical protein